MEPSKLTAKGQITIPAEIRKKLNLKKGDKVYFLEEDGKIYFQNASRTELRSFQEKLTGEAAKAGFESEEDVVRYIKDSRSSSGR